MEVNLPVDIKLSGLGDWLSARRYISSDWADKIKNVFLQVFYRFCFDINYYNCCEIVEILKETEKDSKNFLGFYSSQRMKDWKEIVSLYEKDNLYIAEAAQQLNQLVKFDIPALKRDLSTQEKKIADRVESSKAQRKQADDLRKAYNAELSRRGLKGDNLRLEFFQKTEILDKVCSEAETTLREIAVARQYYADMRSFVLGDSMRTLLPLLQLFLSTNGEATAYQWFYGIAPTIIDRPNFSDILSKLVGPGTQDEIDFGDDDINFEAEIGEEIIELEAHNDFNKITTHEEEIVIDGDVTEAVFKSADHAAVGQEALSLVQNEVTREVLKGELVELLIFLKSATNDNDREHPASLILTGFESNPLNLNVAHSKIINWIRQIEAILSSLNNTENVELFQIRTDPSYVQQLIDQVREPIEKSKRLEDCSKFAIDDIAGLRDVFQKSVEQAKKAIEKAAKLEKQLCSDLTKFTKGRPVHLMGGVKSVETL